MKNLSGNYGGEIGGGVNPEDFKVVEPAEPDTVEIKDVAKLTPAEKEINLDIATQSAEIVKKQGLKLNSLERGAGFAS